MLNRHFGSESGNCYKPDGDGAKFSSYASFSTTDFEKKTNAQNSDWSDIQNLYDVINSTDRLTNTEQWKANLETVFDMNGYLKYLAANTVMQNWDTYGLMTHNYFLYNDPADNKLKWIPWDNNEALNDDKNNALDFDFGTVVSNQWPLIGYVYGIPEYKTIYDNYIDSFIAGPFNPSVVNPMYQDYHDLIYSSVQNESGDYTLLNNFADFTNSLSAQQNHCNSRNIQADVYTP